MRVCLVRSEDAVVCGQPGVCQDPADSNWLCARHASLAKRPTSAPRSGRQVQDASQLVGSGAGRADARGHQG